MHAELFVGIARCRQAEVGRWCCIDGLGRQVREVSFRWCPPGLRHLLLDLREQADEVVVGVEWAGLSAEMVAAITCCEVAGRVLEHQVVDAAGSLLPARRRALPSTRAACIARLLLLAEYPPKALPLEEVPAASGAPPAKLPGWMQRCQQRFSPKSARRSESRGDDGA
jgi:hypothetical protein